MEAHESEAAVSAMEADLLDRMDREDRRFWRGFERGGRVYARRTFEIGRVTNGMTWLKAQLPWCG